MNLDRLFQAGVVVAIFGVVWTVWPQGDGPVYTETYRVHHATYRHGPTILIDRGHWNRSNADPRFDGLAQTLTSDGYQVSRNRQQFVPELLRGTWVLVVADALGWKGAADLAGFGLSPRAFAPEEVACVRDWVHRGGALFLVADRKPAGQASQELANAFGVRLADTPVTPARFNPAGQMGDDVRYALTFGGGKLTGPTDSVEFLRDQGVALGFGRGRVVVLTAQLAGPRRSDNRQLVLNIMHWLCKTD